MDAGLFRTKRVSGSHPSQPRCFRFDSITDSDGGPLPGWPAGGGGRYRLLGTEGRFQLAVRSMRRSRSSSAKIEDPEESVARQENCLRHLWVGLRRSAARSHRRIADTQLEPPTSTAGSGRPFAYIRPLEFGARSPEAAGQPKATRRKVGCPAERARRFTCDRNPHPRDTVAGDLCNVGPAARFRRLFFLCRPYKRRTIDRGPP